LFAIPWCTWQSRLSRQDGRESPESSSVRLGRISFIFCSITALSIPSYTLLTLLFPKTPEQHVQAGRLRDARRCRQQQLGRSSWKSRRHGHETFGQEARTECTGSASRSNQDLTPTDRPQRNFHSISILGLTCVIMCTWMGILSYVVRTQLRLGHFRQDSDIRKAPVSSP
jgi:hypothetical protein